MKTNILYIINTIDNGGTEKQLTQLILKINRKKFQPHLCTLHPSAINLKELGIPVIELKFRGFISLSIIKEIKSLLKFMKEKRIHLVQTFFQDPTLFGVILKIFQPIILIGSFRDMGFWRSSLSSLKMKICYPFYDGFIANSKAVKEHYCKSDKISPQRIKIIYNGIDTNTAYLSNFENRSKQYENRAAVIGIVSNLNRPVKRVQDFIKAASIVSSDIPDAKFLVIGDGYLKEQLMRESEQLGLASSITFLGRINNPHQYVKIFDVGVISSESEGLSNSIIEYMACGIPVVATEAGGNSELITNGYNGYLVPVGDPAALADKILKILKNRELSGVISSRNKRKIENNFSIDKMIRQHEKYYYEAFEN